MKFLKNMIFLMVSFLIAVITHSASIGFAVYIIGSLIISYDPEVRFMKPFLRPLLSAIAFIGIGTLTNSFALAVIASMLVQIAEIQK